ncbi:LOW QUALITY PROTEIN: caspase recruitment domain-containing protein 10 [Perca fluviatilis]|uniref:LOW QUALITY PROTEIN: caspase recruitment domain-containing protein 10 n=1 Tax=Perca fluviatilis TaxID=8168 RepID=UPI00196527BA|nr:LOW QUALITY PROTEIN: caspase recruitment domain-containing protein 10 [Perca fluviatilis]
MGRRGRFPWSHFQNRFKEGPDMSGVTVWAEEGDIAQEEVQSSPPWSEERCEELWDRVEGVRHKLTRILNPAKLTPYLRQCKVIDEQDEDEVLNSTQYPLRISKAGRLLDILRGQGPRGLQAFMESLEFYHPDQYTQLTGEQATQRCSLILDEEGPEGLTQFLLLEVRKLREQLRNTRLCERRLSQRCRMAEEERNRAERKAQDLRQDKLQLERLRHDWESASRELGKLKDRHLEQAVKYSRALEEQGMASSRERELLRQVEELKSRLTEAEKHTVDTSGNNIPAKRNSLLSNGVKGSPPALPEKPQRRTEVQKEENTGTQMKDSGPTTGVIALMDILQQDRREAADQRQELCDIITRLQGELQSTEEHWEKLESQCEQLQLKVRTLQLDWETEQKRSMSYFNQIMELEKERDQALRSRDSLQLEYTDCLLDKNRLRKRIAELQANVEQQQRELEKERERGRELTEQSSLCLNCSHLSLCSEDQCYGPCCSLGLDLRPQAGGTRLLLRKTPSSGQANENSEDSRSNSEENLRLSTQTEDNEKEINRLSTFPFPPCMNSINRRFNTEFDLESSWGSDENDNITGEPSEPSLWDSCNSLHSHLFPPDLVNLPAVSPHQPNTSAPRIPSRSPSSSPPISPKHGRTSLADDITLVGGNQTGIFVSHVRAGSPAQLCGLKEGSELLELERVLFGGGSVMLGQCTAEVAHFSLQWWSEPSTLKHQSNPEGYSKLCSQLSSPTFMGADSFYVRVNLNMEPCGDPPSLGVSCDDIIHVTDTRYNKKYNWHCSLVDPHTAKPLQAGTMPNYNRAQQLLLVRLRKMSLEQKDFKRRFLKKPSGRVRLVKAVDPSGRGIGSTQQVLYTLNKRHEEHLIPYSLVQPVQVQTKRPVIFSPSLLSRGLIERLLQPADSGLKFNTCLPEPIQASERRGERVFLLDPRSPKQALGIRLQSIQDVISQDKHCLLELGLPSVEGLLRQGIYPIVIHIRPKNKKHKTLRKLFPRCGEDSVMEEVCQAEELQLETLPLLYYTLEPSAWSSTEELLAAIRNAIHSQQRAVAWIELDRLQ